MPGNLIHSYHDVMLHYGNHGNSLQSRLGRLHYFSFCGSTAGYLVDDTCFPHIRRVFVFIDVYHRMQLTNSLCDNVTEQNFADGVCTMLEQVNINCIFLAIDRAGMGRYPQAVANRCGMPVFAPQGDIRIDLILNNFHLTHCFLVKDPRRNRIRYFWPQL